MRTDPAFVPLITERLRLRRSVPEDADAISAYRSDPEVRRYQGWGDTGPREVRVAIEEMMGRAPGDPGGWVQLSVEDRRTGRLVGDVGLSPAEHHPGVVKIGYTIDPEFQGSGYATEAVRALIDYAFDVLDAVVVRAYASAENTASIRVAEKSGLRLVERFDGVDDGVRWHGVRYELRREDRDRSRGATNEL
jgi:RimJ/RimL family protein N-acetyltransferase